MSSRVADVNISDREVVDLMRHAAWQSTQARVGDLGQYHAKCRHGDDVRVSGGLGCPVNGCVDARAASFPALPSGCWPQYRRVQ